jgi:hypothetical protein
MTYARKSNGETQKTEATYGLLTMCVQLALSVAQ